MEISLWAQQYNDNNNETCTVQCDGSDICEEFQKSAQKAGNMHSNIVRGNVKYPSFAVKETFLWSFMSQECIILSHYMVLKGWLHSQLRS